MKVILDAELLSELISAIDAVPTEEVRWHFKPEGLWFHCPDASHTQSFGALIPKTDFKSYEIEGESEVCFSLADFKKLIKGMKGSVMFSVVQNQIIVSSQLRVFSISTLADVDYPRLEEELKMDEFCVFKCDLDELIESFESCSKVLDEVKVIYEKGKVKVFSYSEERSVSSYSLISPFGWRGDSLIAFSFRAGDYLKVLKGLRKFGGIAKVKMSDGLIKIEVPCIGGRKVWGYKAGVA